MEQWDETERFAFTAPCAQPTTCKPPQYRCRLGCILVIWVAFFSRRQRYCGLTRRLMASLWLSYFETKGKRKQ